MASAMQIRIRLMTKDAEPAFEETGSPANVRLCWESTRRFSEQSTTTTLPNQSQNRVLSGRMKKDRTAPNTPLTFTIESFFRRVIAGPVSP
jgi:hypothetical protein